jgi:DNA-binding NarL/FixJ family response regulator
MTPKERPTRRQLEVLRAYVAAGSIAAAAYELGISETTARQHLSGLYRRTGCMNAAQAAYWLGTERAERRVGKASTAGQAVRHSSVSHPEPTADA